MDTRAGSVPRYDGRIRACGHWLRSSREGGNWGLRCTAALTFSGVFDRARQPENTASGYRLSVHCQSQQSSSVRATFRASPPPWKCLVRSAVGDQRQLDAVLRQPSFITSGSIVLRRRRRLRSTSPPRLGTPSGQRLAIDVRRFTVGGGLGGFEHELEQAKLHGLGLERIDTWMSRRYFLVSSRIEQRLGPVDRLAEVTVLDGGGHHQVNRTVEERFEAFQ